MRLARMQPIDWAVLIGGPALFFVIFWVGMQAIMGPPPPVNPVAELKAGRVRVGIREADVVRAVGPPTARVESPDGSFYFRYQRSGWRPEDKSPVEEDAYIDFSAMGTVVNITFDSRVPPSAGQ